MKNIITVILIAFSLTASAQVDSLKFVSGTVFNGISNYFVVGGGVPNTYFRSTVVSTYDTTILNKGKDSCKHVFVEEIQPFSFMSCAVYHGDTGCPDNWLNVKSICENCLRHIHVKETRRSEPIPNKYAELLKKLQ